VKILVTGGCGFIGSNLVRFLLTNTQHQVINLDKLTYAGNPNSLNDLADSDRYQFIQVDIADPEAVRKAMEESDPDWIAHLAAESHVDRSIDGPSEFIKTNVVGTFNLLDSARSHFQQLSPERAEKFSIQGCFGPFSSSLENDLWFTSDRHQLFQQLRPRAVP